MLERKSEKLKGKNGVYQRGDVWLAVVEYPRDAAGKRKRVWLTDRYRTKKEAIGARDRARVDIRNGIDVAPAKLRVDAYLRRWLETTASRVAPLPSVIKLAVVQTYALDVWLWGNGGGTCLLSSSNGKWTILACGGGDMNAGIISAYGVPSLIATELISGLQPIPSPTSVPTPLPTLNPTPQPTATPYNMSWSILDYFTKQPITNAISIVNGTSVVGGNGTAGILGTQALQISAPGYATYNGGLNASSGVKARTISLFPISSGMQAWLNQINADRIANGTSVKVQLDDNLTITMFDHAADMSSKKYLNDTDPALPTGDGFDPCLR